MTQQASPKANLKLFFLRLVGSLNFSKVRFISTFISTIIFANFMWINSNPVFAQIPENQQGSVSNSAEDLKPTSPANCELKPDAIETHEVCGPTGGTIIDDNITDIIIVPDYSNPVCPRNNKDELIIICVTL